MEFDFLQNVLRGWGVSLPAGWEEKLAVYCQVLIEYNQKVNLIADSTVEEIVSRHFLDSLACLLGMDGACPKDYAVPLLDVGSGAGFPGLVLKLARPALKLTLLEATGKKCEFLERLIKTLKLTEAEVLWGRAENFGQNPDYRGKFFWVTSRGVSNLASLNELCLPFLVVGGVLIAQKGKGVDEEIKEAGNSLKILGGNLEKILPYTLKSKDFNLVMIKKIFPSPPKYPRRDGLPQKKPLT